MRKILLFTFIFIFCLSVNVFAIDDISIMINGEYIQMDVNPIIQNGRTLVPIRVVEQLGIPVNWDGSTKTVRLGTPAEYIDIQIDSFNVTKFKNGIKNFTRLEVAPILYSDRTMVPVRFISENFGYFVDWNNETRTVIISSSGDLAEQKVIYGNIKNKVKDFLSQKTLMERKVSIETPDTVLQYQNNKFYHKKNTIENNIPSTSIVNFDLINETCSLVTGTETVINCSKNMMLESYQMFEISLNSYLLSVKIAVDDFLNRLENIDILSNKEVTYYEDNKGYMKYYITTDNNGDIISMKFVVHSSEGKYSIFVIE